MYGELGECDLRADRSIEDNKHDGGGRHGIHARRRLRLSAKLRLSRTRVLCGEPAAHHRLAAALRQSRHEPALDRAEPHFFFFFINSKLFANLFVFK